MQNRKKHAQLQNICQNLQNMMEMFLKDGQTHRNETEAEGNPQKDKGHAKHF